VVRNSVFAHNRPTSGSITAAPALDALRAAAQTTITANTFFDNRVPLAISTNFSLDDSNAFDNGADAAQPVANQYNAVMVEGCGQITGDISWAATKVPFVIGVPVTACNYIVINGGAKLTLAEGVVVKFFSNGWVDVLGQLSANATSAIVFTSIKDDLHLGDTNGDGTSSAPAASDWRGIRLLNSGSTFDKSRFFYGGSEEAPMLYVGDGKSAIVRNSVFAHARGSIEAINSAPALDTSEAAAATVVTGNLFYNNTVPLSISDLMSLDDSNTFDNRVAAPASPQPSKHNAVIVRGCGYVTTSVSWRETEVPFVIGDPTTACSYLNIGGTGHLTLGNDVTVKFFNTGRFEIQPNSNLTVGTGCFFTSYKDDTRKGDTNADGASTSPAEGDWHGIKKFITGEPSPICYAWTSIFYDTPPSGSACTW
jgi:hypothetical protein